MNAQQYLEQVNKLDELIACKMAERERLISIAEDTSSHLPDGMPHNNTGVASKKVENAVIGIVMLDIDKSVAEFVAYREAVLRNLEKLPPREYGALHRHYIQYKPWEEVAEEMGYCTTHIWRIHKKGLEILQDVIECNAQGVK